MRFEIKRAPSMRALLALFGATAARSFVEVEPSGVHVRFGSFDERFSRAEIVGAEPARWRWWSGIGWRIGAGGVGLIGALSPVVRMRLASARKLRVFPGVSWRTDQLYVSVDQPDELIAALRGSAT